MKQDQKFLDKILFKKVKKSTIISKVQKTGAYVILIKLELSDGITVYEVCTHINGYLTRQFYFENINDASKEFSNQVTKVIGYMDKEEAEIIHKKWGTTKFKMCK